MACVLCSRTAPLAGQSGQGAEDERRCLTQMYWPLTLFGTAEHALILIAIQ